MLQPHNKTVLVWSPRRPTYCGCWFSMLALWWGGDFYPAFHLQPPAHPPRNKAVDDGWNMISRHHMTGFRACGSVLQKKTWNILITSKNTTLKAGILDARFKDFMCCSCFCTTEEKTEETKVKAAFSAPQQLWQQVRPRLQMKEEGLTPRSHMWELLFRSHSDVRAAVVALL